MNKMFEVAVRSKLRFPYKGLVGVEDLWDLTPKNLDGIYKELNSEKKVTVEESLLETKNVEEQELDMKIEIIKYIVATKISEQNEALLSSTKRAEQQKIAGIIERKKEKELEDMSVEELQKRLSEI